MPGKMVKIPPGGFAGNAAQTIATRTLVNKALGKKTRRKKKRVTKKRTTKKRAARRASTKKKPAHMVKGSAAAKRKMAKLRKMQKRNR